MKTLSNLVPDLFFSSSVSVRHYEWNSWIPIKVNIWSWIVAIDRLPTRPKSISVELLLHQHLVPCVIQIRKISIISFVSAQQLDLFSLKFGPGGVEIR